MRMDGSRISFYGSCRAAAAVVNSMYVNIIAVIIAVIIAQQHDILYFLPVAGTSSTRM
jgi:hypothetical protein